MLITGTCCSDYVSMEIRAKHYYPKASLVLYEKLAVSIDLESVAEIIVRVCSSFDRLRSSNYSAVNNAIKTGCLHPIYQMTGVERRCESELRGREVLVRIGSDSTEDFLFYLHAAHRSGLFVAEVDMDASVEIRERVFPAEIRLRLLIEIVSEYYLLLMDNVVI